MISMLLRPFLLLILIVPLAMGQQPQQRPVTETPKPLTSTPQNPPDVDSQDVVKITTNLVQVDAVVTRDGHPVKDLQAEDFEIFEDDKPQVITNFSYISNVQARTVNVATEPRSKDKVAVPVPPAKINLTDQRRTIALVIDDLGLSFESIPALKSQLRKFLDGLAPNDLVAIVRTSGEVGALQQFTNDKRVLQAAFNNIRWNPCSRSGLRIFAPAGAISSNVGLCSQYVIGGTFKAINFILKGMSYLPGRKSMVIFSDYLPVQDQQPSAYDEARTSLRSQTDTSAADDPNLPDPGINYYGQLLRIAELAIRSSVVIYAVDTRGLQPTGLTAADRLTATGEREKNTEIASIIRGRSEQMRMGNEGSDLIAKQTGGFLVRNSNDFGLPKVMEDQDGYYLIGFRPHEETFNHNFHHIKVRVKRGGLAVRTRAGFYGFTEAEARPPQLNPADQMRKALISPFSPNDITVHLTSFFVDDPAKGPVVRSFLFMDSRDFTFTDQAGDWHLASLDISTAVFGDNGKVIEQQDHTGSLRFHGEAYQRALHEGIVYSFDMPMKARGAFQFRVAVRDARSGRIGAAGQFVQIPNLGNGQLALSGIVARAAEIPNPGNTPADFNQNEIMMGPAVRRFPLGSTITFAYAIYNSAAQGRPAELTTQTRIFRDGKIVLTGNPTPFDPEGQLDRQRPAHAARIQLGSEMALGDYVFQIIVTDSSDRKKLRVASQWIDFEVVK